RRQQDVREVSIPIRRMEILDDRAIGDDLGAHPSGVPQGDQLHFGAVLSLSKISLLHPFQILRLARTNECGRYPTANDRSPEGMLHDAIHTLPSSPARETTYHGG